MTDPHHQRLHQQRQQQEQHHPPAAVVATAEEPRCPSVGVFGILPAMVVLLGAMFAEFRFFQVSTFRNDDTIVQSTGATIVG